MEDIKSAVFNAISSKEANDRIGLTVYLCQKFKGMGTIGAHDKLSETLTQLMDEKRIKKKDGTENVFEVL